MKKLPCYFVSLIFFLSLHIGTCAVLSQAEAHVRACMSALETFSSLFILVFKRSSPTRSRRKSFASLRWCVSGKRGRVKDKAGKVCQCKFWSWRDEIGFTVVNCAPPVKAFSTLFLLASLSAAAWRKTERTTEGRRKEFLFCTHFNK